MGILVSGQDEAWCRHFIGSESWAKHEIQWCTPGALSTDATDHQVIWFYRAPWTVLETTAVASAASLLARWLDENRAILNMRRKLCSNVLLVSPDRVSPADLRGRLEGNQTPILASHAKPETPPAQLLGPIFEKVVPQYWDVLEALEAAAWLPSGEPLFRGTVTISEEQLFSLLEVLNEAPRLKREIAQMRQIAGEKASDELKIRQENREFKQDGDLLLMQLHQVQEELEQHYLKNLELDKTAVEDKNELNALQIQLRQMQDELTHQQVLNAPVTTPPPDTTEALPSKPTNGIASETRAAAWRPLASLRKVLNRSRKKGELPNELDTLRNSEWFDKQWYLDQYPDVRAAGVDPVEHYLTNGWKESRKPSAGFDTAYYLHSNPDVVQSGLNPLWHFVQFGRKEGRLPRKAHQ